MNGKPQRNLKKNWNNPVLFFYEVTREAVLDMWDMMWAAYETEKEEKEEEKEEEKNGKSE